MPRWRAVGAEPVERGPRAMWHQGPWFGAAWKEEWVLWTGHFAHSLQGLQGAALSRSWEGSELLQPPPGSSPEPEQVGSGENSEVPLAKLVLSGKENPSGYQPVLRVWTLPLISWVTLCKRFNLSK